jgi:hypothetical protein
MWKWNWQTASEGDLRLIEAISLALGNHDKLLEFLFDPKRPRLASDPDDLLERSRCFSSAERVLVAVAIDIWSQSANAPLWQVIYKLDAENFSNVVLSLQYLAANQGYEEPLNRGQLKIPTL